MVDRSYLPFKSAREYQDRGMKKWMGFFLSEHTANLKQQDAKDKFVYTPLDEMSQEESSEILFEAYKYRKKVEVSLRIIQDEKYVFLQGYVEGVHDRLVVMDSGTFRMEAVRAVKEI